jgi:hypothetical protein
MKRRFNRGSLQLVLALGLLAAVQGAHAVGGAAVDAPGPRPIAVDRHGNVGYATAEDCDAAVAAGTAIFYTPATTHPPLRRTGEYESQTLTVADLVEAEDAAERLGYNPADYVNGACDRGIGRAGNRDGVAGPLIGTWVPYRATMPVNVYYDVHGNIVRASMAQCDNNFAAAVPRPIPGPEVSVVILPDQPLPLIVQPSTVVSQAPLAPGLGGLIGAGIVTGGIIAIIDNNRSDPPPVSP